MQATWGSRLHSVRDLRVHVKIAFGARACIRACTYVFMRACEVFVERETSHCALTYGLFVSGQI